jgi:hypothetical protein
MLRQHRRRMNFLTFAVILGISFTSLWGCATGPVPRASQEVSVAPIGAPGPGATPSGIKRQQLEAEIMRFADRYAGSMAAESHRIRQSATTPEHRWASVGLDMASRAAVLDIAVGPNAVENLLDMLVLTSLTSRAFEEYWAPKFLGPELGGGLIRAAKKLEEDIWHTAGQVLTEDQQSDLKALIQDWRKEHADQHDFWDVRFAGFSGQRATELERIAQTGGLLGEVQQARATAEQMQEFGERVLYYLQRAPTITRLQAQFAVYDLMRQPEFEAIIHDANRFTETTQRFAQIAESLPSQRLEAINQFMEQLEKQRKGLLDDLVGEEAKIRGLLGELRQTVLAGQDLAKTVDNTVTSVDQLAVRLNLGASEGKPFDINEYREFLIQASKTARDMDKLVASTNTLMAPLSGDDARKLVLPLIDDVDARTQRLVDRIFLLEVIVIAVFFAALLGYRYMGARFVRKEKI